MENLKKILKCFNDLLDAIWIFMPSFVMVCAIYVCLMAIEQGVDVLIIVGENIWSAIFSLIAVIFWSFLAWYSSRIMSLVKQTKKEKENIFIKHLPRYFAYNCFIAIQCSILALRCGFDMSGWCIVLFILFHTLYFIILSKAFTREKTSAWFKATIIVGMLYIVFLVVTYLYIYYKQKEVKPHLLILQIEAFILFGFQILFLWFYTVRKCIKWLIIPKESNYLLKPMIWLGINPYTANFESRYFLFYNIFFFGVTIIYILGILNLQVAVFISPMAFSIIVFTMLVGYFNLMAALSRKLNFNLNILLLVVAFIVGKYCDPHNVRTYKKEIATKQITTDSFLTAWLNHTDRRNEIEDTSKIYTAYIVLSDGGGSRAGTWVSMVMAKLQDTTNGNFGKHIFCIAGASGGTVGNSAFYSLLKADMDNEPVKTLNKSALSYGNHLRNYFSSDFLSFTIGRFLGVDFFRHILPFVFKDDRAVALERGFENKSCDTIISKYFKKDITEVFDNSGKLPAYFINSTSVQDGIPGYISNIKLNGNSKRINILNLLPADSSISLSTATVLSARFPFVSPAGKIRNYYFVDGGYFDNSGAGTVFDFMNEVFKALPADKKDKIRFQLIAIHNSDGRQKEFNKMHPMTNDVFTPFLTLVGMQDANTKVGNNTLYNFINKVDGTNATVEFNLYYPSPPKAEDIKRGEEPYSMSWVNSEYQMQRMENRLDSLTNEINFKNIVDLLNKKVR